MFIFVSEVGRVVSLAALASLGARFDCGVHSCLCGRVFTLVSEVLFIVVFVP